MTDSSLSLEERRKKAARANRNWRQHISALCREYTRDAVLTLVEIMGDPTMPPSSRVRAADSILDRGWGKAPMVIKTQDAGGVDLSKASEAELLAIIAENTKSIRDIHAAEEAEAAETDEFDDMFDDDEEGPESDGEALPLPRSKKIH